MSSQGPRTLEAQLLLFQTLIAHANNSQSNVAFSSLVENEPVNEMQLRQQALYKNNQNPKKEKPTRSHHEYRDTPINHRIGSKKR